MMVKLYPMTALEFRVVVLSRDSIIIEDNVMIGGGCMVFDTEFHPVSYQNRLCCYEMDS